ncbi:hypothetical protein LBMAG34_1810 [Candidatus Saccharibacteria bacterium]|nr:hypothetical protein LBMAG34_1810 [Candidatus Saccharibacteria bacterium]
MNKQIAAAEISIIRPIETSPDRVIAGLLLKTMKLIIVKTTMLGISKISPGFCEALNDFLIE